MMQEVTVQGWVRTSRFAENHNIMFVELTDGSTVRGMQLVLTVATTVVSTSHFYYAVA
jgi:aspartyl/asparaginyl-tRNA synthetase